MTRYVTVTKIEPVEAQHGVDRIWLYANDPESFPVGKTFQI